MRPSAEMTSDRWERIKQLFFESMRLSQGERDGFLAHACADDAQLRAEINSLLAAYDDPGSFLRHGAISGMTRTLRSRPLAGFGSEDRFVPGAVFADRFRIISLVGQGGMGEVYRATICN